MFKSFKRHVKKYDVDVDDHEEEASFTLVLADTAISFLLVTLALFTLVMLLPHDKKSTQSPAQMGVLCVELSWPNNRNVDIDLWGHSPGDKNTVGYSNMHGETLNLLRDVVGFGGNPTHQMVEVMCADRLIPGEWTFNAHYFANHEAELNAAAADDPRKAVEVTMIVRIRNKSDTFKDTFMSRYTLTREKQEKTMLDFVIGSDGDVIKDSINSIDKPLKGGWRQ